MRILCVAEKPSIAKAVANILGGKNVNYRNSKNKYVKNYDFKFKFDDIHGICDVTMTSVLGHITQVEFPSKYSWGKCHPGKLFDAPTVMKIIQKEISDNIANEARTCDKLMIWTDCDREGEYIGKEIFDAAKTYNKNIVISNTWRSKFSHLERNHVIAAAKNPIQLDMKAVAAVSCRMEIDLKVGASFTRLLTDNFKNSGIIEKEKGLISYGTCQFPTLGFVTDRYKRVKNFKPEPFWYIDVAVKKGKKVNFNWVRNHFFDRLFVINLYENCIQSGEHGTITKLDSKKTTNYRPLPLTTVELQKDCAKYLKFSAKRTLTAAENLYNRGFISYPRTETEKYPRSMNFKGIFEKQTQDPRWGSYAANLVNNGHTAPREGSRDDESHPAIHPVNYVSLEALDNADEKKIYEYVVRRFLACCSKDAIGQTNTVTLKWGDEFFTASGLNVLEKNYLEVFTYKKWESSKELPNFEEGERVKLSSGLLKEGKTSPPNYMTEQELIALMDKNQIGTDATIAEHIDKISKRDYIKKQKRGKIDYLIPTPLGMGLVEGLDKMEFNGISLSKPFLRKNLELSLLEITQGRNRKDQVVDDMKKIYSEALGICNFKMQLLINECRGIIRQNV
ncbi:unnamed protein product [Candida verbasci]|uniref:DNA topoisomerase n=1 Tax=Candida verbasci TaxID=1227364 RepID=A0A9W4TWC3_9ASCO|nr:unnamed protein product [Candida verbasci]